MNMHLLSALYYPSLILPDSAYRCQRCGQGPVTSSDGFLMAHCLNCGTYHASAWDSGEFGVSFSWMKTKLTNFFALLRSRVGAMVRSTTAPVDTPNAEVG